MYQMIIFKDNETGSEISQYCGIITIPVKTYYLQRYTNNLSLSEFYYYANDNKLNGNESKIIMD